LKEDPYQIMLESRIDAFDFWTQPRLPIQCAGWEGPNNCVRSMTAQLLRYHSVQSVFAPVAVPLNETLGTLRPQRDGVESTFALKAEINVGDYSHQLNPTRGERQIIVWLMMESSWQLAISTLERNWQRLRYRVTKQTGGESFMMLTGLRRQVADAQNFIAESKSIFTRTIRETGTWAINGRLINADEFWSSRSGAPTTAVFRHAQSMDIRNLPDTFEKMEEKIVNKTRAINQEIQVVIGSVQVEDAKTMKRQTEWMVVLALLAAIYLPMTLVTGIFGMNISEINADETLPSRWAALKAWGVVFGATLGCLVVYAMVRHAIRWLLEQRELAKAEAMHVEALKLK
jgi:membrane protein YqaA with SNARE-associated domain